MKSSFAHKENFVKQMLINGKKVKKVKCTQKKNHNHALRIDCESLSNNTGMCSYRKNQE